MFCAGRQQGQDSSNRRGGALSWADWRHFHLSRFACIQKICQCRLPVSRIPNILHSAGHVRRIAETLRAREHCSLEQCMVGRCVFPRQFSRQSSNRASSLPPSEMAAWRAVARVLRSPLDAVSCAVFPSLCRLCNQPLVHLSTAPICADCWHDLPEQAPINLCAVCGELLGLDGVRFATNAARRHSDGEPLCPLCERARPPFQWAVAYGVYEGTLRALIHLLKYERIPTVAGPLGALLAASIAQRNDLPASLAVVAVPLHATRQHERGFNQTVLLAEATVRALRKLRPELQIELACEAMGRQRATESQSGLKPHQRRRNLRGAFFIRRPDQIAGRSILLLDDIYTTGATARECTRTLLRAGAATVYVATLARSQREGVAFWDFVPAGKFTAVGMAPTDEANAAQGFEVRD